MKALIERTSDVKRTARVMQLEGMFDLPPSQTSSVRWEANVPLESRDWNVGLVVGPSGCGKSTVIRELWGEHVADSFEWPHDRAVVDAFPRSMSMRDVTALLSSVGFSSPPAWLRPFSVLSNGEQFRSHVARALAEAAGGTVVLDEFTSVVDRQVAQIGSAAIAKTVRARDSQLIAATCHYDVEDWLQPDWVYQPHVDSFTWRSVQPRPAIELDITRCESSSWQLFRPHHYLSHTLNKSARCYLGTIDGTPAVFMAVIAFPHAQLVNAYRVHRLVTLPDFQGVGIGNRFADYIAGVYRGSARRLYLTTSHPALTRSFARNRKWRMGRGASMTAAHGKGSVMGPGQELRFTSSFEYIGPPVESPLTVELGEPPNGRNRGRTPVGALNQRPRRGKR